jgi:hypothetical protein
MSASENQTLAANLAQQERNDFCDGLVFVVIHKFLAFNLVAEFLPSDRAAS